MIQNFLGLVVSLIVLIWSCEFAIKNSILVSKIFNIREIFVGIFIIAIGTSLPEFAATFQALQMGAEGIVAGNLVGSNIANILLVGGITVFPLKSLNVAKQDQSTAIFFICFSILSKSYFSVILPSKKSGINEVICKPTWLFFKKER